MAPVPTIPPLPKDGCQIAWARPHLAEADALTSEVRDRIARLRRPEDRARHATAAALAQALVVAHGGVSARLVRAPGRPLLVDGARLNVSVTHGGRWVGAAVAAHAPVGVDLEPLDPELDVDALTRITLAPDERNQIDDMTDPVARARAILVTWTRKEAILKATGDGLRLDPSRVHIAPPTAPAELLAYPGRPDLSPATTALRDVAPDAHHVGAVALLATGPPNLTSLDGEALLAACSARR